MKEKNVWAPLLRGLSLPVAAAASLLCFAAALNGLENGRKAEALSQLDTVLRRGCVTCYAAEGIYPPDLEYLKEYYGVQVDEKQYTVYYDRFAENLMPDITVLENEP